MSERKMVLSFHYPGKPDRHFEVIFNDEYSNQYTRLTSLNAFRENEAAKVFGRTTKFYEKFGGSYYKYAATVRWCSVDNSPDLTDKFNSMCGIVRAIEKTFDDLWEFYKFVGYDRKTKKYIYEPQPIGVLNETTKTN